MIVVILDTFSGLTNPEWQLTAKQQAEFIRRFAAAPIISTGAPHLEEPLGYRGFRVRTARTGQLPAELRIYNGWIIGDSQVRRDRGRTMERWLLSTGAAILGPDLTRQVDGEISGKGPTP